MKFRDITMPAKLGDTSRNYAEWKQEVLAVLYLPEYKLRKLWRLNFSVADIQANRHYEVFQTKDPKALHAQRIARRDKRGRLVSRKNIDTWIAQAVLTEYERILSFHRLESAELEFVREQIGKFKEIIFTLKEPKWYKRQFGKIDK